MQPEGLLEAGGGQRGPGEGVPRDGARAELQQVAALPGQPLLVRGVRGEVVEEEGRGVGGGVDPRQQEVLHRRGHVLGVQLGRAQPALHQGLLVPGLALLALAELRHLVPEEGPGDGVYGGEPLPGAGEGLGLPAQHAVHQTVVRGQHVAVHLERAVGKIAQVGASSVHLLRSL